jgi:hypothetical protein
VLCAHLRREVLELAAVRLVVDGVTHGVPGGAHPPEEPAGGQSHAS